MATFTSKLLLRKPATTDNINVTTDISDNMDLIDTAFTSFQPGFKNQIRNGDMGVAQRGNGSFTAVNVYTADGWLKTHVGGTHSIDRVVTAPGSDNGMNGAGWRLQSIVTTQSAAGDYATLQQRIEGVRTLAGKEVTLSFIAFATAGTPKIGVEVSQNFGTGGAPSADVNTAVSAVTTSTTAVRYTVTFTVPSIVGKTLGTGGNDYLQVNLWLSAGSTFAARASSIGIQNSVFYISDLQLEQGGATAFERLPQQMQLAWCQRYFYRMSATGSDMPVAAGVAYSTVLAVHYKQFPVQMRATPTAPTTFLGTGEVVTGGVVSPDISSIAVAVDSQNAQINASTTGLTVGHGSMLRSGSTNTFSIDFTAEL